MNKEFELDENGNVIDKFTFGELMTAMSATHYKKSKPKEIKEPFIPKKGVLFIDILEMGCYGCPCCDNEMTYCTVLPGGPACEYKEFLPDCPITEITITPEVFAERMRNAIEEGTEDGHMIMDDLMCELLRELGYGEGIDIFENTHKWYA